ncbi:MAG: hypothetical protein U5R31_05980 [Acidimicrobiia bacterium]|nr:hypothetical protein [Acidimicrobiia bacterium]
MPGALLTDHYELAMAASYLRRGMRAPATFSLFAREIPVNRGYLVAAGLEPCLEFLENLSFTDDDLTYLERTGQFDAPALEAFADLRFTGDVWAMPEGTVAFADEPLLEVTAPLPEAQVVETVLLNLVTVHTSLAVEGRTCPAGRRRGQGRGLRVPTRTGPRRRDGTRPGGRDHGLRRHQQRRIGSAARHRLERHDGPLLRRSLRHRARGVRDLRRGPPWAADLPGRHLRHARRRPYRDRRHPRQEPGAALGRPARQRRPRGPRTTHARPSRRRWHDRGVDPRQRWTGRVPHRRAPSGRRADRRLRTRHPGRGLGGQPPVLETAYKLVEYDERPVSEASRRERSPHRAPSRSFVATSSKATSWRCATSSPRTDHVRSWTRSWAAASAPPIAPSTR